MDFRRAVHGEKEFVAEVGDQHHVRSRQTGGGNRPAGNALRELHRAADERLDGARAGDDVAHFHAVFFECSRVDGDEQRRLQQRHRRHGDVDDFERKLRAKCARRRYQENNGQKKETRPTLHHSLLLLLIMPPLTPRARECPAEWGRADAKDFLGEEVEADQETAEYEKAFHAVGCAAL